MLEGQWIKVVGRHGLPRGPCPHHGCRSFRNNPARHASYSHRQQPEDLLGRYTDRSNARATRHSGARGANCQCIPGLSRISQGAPSRTRQRHSLFLHERSPTGPYAHASGNYTRYGDVKSLVSDSDDKFVVFSSGEGLKLDFDPSRLPGLSAGWVRDYFFYADGFEKDLDFYAADAFTVEPLPRHTDISYPYPVGKEYPLDDEHLKYELEYNTRTCSDRHARQPALYISIAIVRSNSWRKPE